MNTTLNANHDQALTTNETALLTPEQLARRLGITRRLLGSWSRSKIIPMVKIGRICRYDLAKVMAALTQYEQAPAATSTPR